MIPAPVREAMTRIEFGPGAAVETKLRLTRRVNWAEARPHTIKAFRQWEADRVSRAPTKRKQA